MKFGALQLLFLWKLSCISGAFQWYSLPLHMPTQLCQVRHSGENLKNLIRTNSMSIGTVLFDISHLLNHITVDAGPSFPLPNGDVLLNRANISIGTSRISLPSGAQTVTAIGEPIPFINDISIKIRRYIVYCRKLLLDLYDALIRFKHISQLYGLWR